MEILFNCVRLMTLSTSRLMFKGLEEEVYTGLADGQIVGIQERIDHALPGFQTEPDRRNPEFVTSPARSYDQIGSDLVRMRTRLRNWLQRQGNYTLIPGATMSRGDSNVFLISDPNNKYYKYIRDAYGTRVVTTSTHINIGIDDVETIVRATRLLRAEACLFLALTAASPFLDDEVTGHHSTRWVIFPDTPAKVPLFESYREYEMFVNGAIADGRIQNNRHLWISVRPNGPDVPHQINRVELRICDYIYDPRIILGITALAEARIQQLVTNPSLDPLVASELPASTRAEDLLQLIEQNEAAVATYSLDATVRHWRDGRPQPVREWLKTYLAEALAIAKPLGFGQYLKPLLQIAKSGNVAMKWLDQHKRGASIAAIMGQSVVDMKETEMLYSAHCKEAPPEPDQITSWDKFYSEYNTRLANEYPSISALSEPWQNRNIISPYKIYVPQSVIDSITKAVDNIFRLSRKSSYREAVLGSPVDREILSSPAPNLSVLMSYDFHLDGETPRLLEINTNASGYLLADALYNMHTQPNPFPQAMNSLNKAFTEEFQQLGIKGSPHIAIIDEAPHTQKMFPEFLLYKSLFEKWGYTADIYDYTDLTYREGALFAEEKKIDFIYNRYCDFTLSDPSSDELRRAYLGGACGFSPNPKEYILLADKKRLVQMSSDGWLESVSTPDISVDAISSVLCPTWHASEFADITEVWQQRKQWFFKPAQSYGGASAYRGNSISHKVFNRVMSEDTLIQQYVPAAKIRFDSDVTSAVWKYDLRAYAYGSEVQMLVARIYQGQITNFKKAYGGYCPVFVSKPDPHPDSALGTSQLDWKCLGEGIPFSQYTMENI